MYNKIFQIGFNKCGTTSIFHVFKKHCTTDLKCIHWDNGKVAREIHFNTINNKLPILGQYESYDVFTDMEDGDSNNLRLAHRDHFKVLDKCYPRSAFILNTRPIDEWIQSRITHIKGKFIKYHAQVNGVSEFEMIKIWKYWWYEHIKNVEEYFTGRNNLLRYDIRMDDFSKFKDFFKDLEFTIDELPKSNKTY
tara:strand:+ start:1740 stop:2318 length:579 start_codon:yes stop_codon:yes gene_type:complete